MRIEQAPSLRIGAAPVIRVWKVPLHSDDGPNSWDPRLIKIRAAFTKAPPRSYHIWRSSVTSSAVVRFIASGLVWVLIVLVLLHTSCSWPIQNHGQSKATLLVYEVYAITNTRLESI